tara:strand:- start:17798 stop:19291 length:1494 start_codon:yes stop_codon:yes gene_type:complete
MKINNIITFFFVSIVISIPFLEFIQFNHLNINYNSDLQVNFLTLKRLFGFYLFLLMIFFIVLIFLNKVTNSNKFDLIIFLSFSYWLLFKYNDLKKFFNFEIFKNFSKYDGYISFIFIILIFLIFLIFYVKKKTKFINNFVFIYLVLNFLLLIGNISTNNSSSNEVNKNIFKHKKVEIINLDRKNIYFFVLDAMPPIEISDKIFGTNSNKFLDDLSSKGFEYIRNSSSFYGNTFFAIGSLFNFGVFEGKKQKIAYSINEMKYPELAFPTFLRGKNTSNLEFNLNNLGYNIKWIGNHFFNCQGYNRAYCIDEIESSNLFFNYEILSFLKKTPFEPLAYYISKIIGFNYEKKILFEANNGIKKFNKFLIQNGKPNIPTFIFVHHTISHWPYLANSNCDFEKNYGKNNITGIKKVLECNKKLIKETINTISEYDKEAVVIFQSDHSWELSNLDSNKYGDRKHIFNLVKLNEVCKNKYDLLIENINIGKIILYCATETVPNF